MKEWHYINNGEQVGPVSLEELQKLATCGTLGLESPVREQGRKWMTAVDAVPELFKPSADGPDSDAEPGLFRPKTPASIGLCDESARKQWFYMHDGEAVGPVTTDTLCELARLGFLEAGSPLRTEDGEWTTAAALNPQLFGGLGGLTNATTLDAQTGTETDIKLIMCKACSRKIAVDSKTCPACGSANQWMHPEISRFLDHADELDRRVAGGFQYEYKGCDLFGAGSVKKVSTPVKVLLTAMLAGFLIYNIVVSGVMGSSELVIDIGVFGWLIMGGAFIGLIVIIGLPWMIGGEDVGRDVALKKFDIDFSSTPPRWSSNDDMFWAEIKKFFRVR